jgi:hypothetical protein
MPDHIGLRNGRPQQSYLHARHHVQGSGWPAISLPVILFDTKKRKKAARAAAFFEGRPKVFFSVKKIGPSPKKLGGLLSRLFIQFKAKGS